jgi:signal transduction histidine kinase
MTDSSTLAAAGFHFFPALVWTIVTRGCWRLLRSRQPQGQLFRILPLFAALMAAHYFAHMVIELTPTQLGGAMPGLHRSLLALIAVSQVGSAALFRHLVPLLAIREEVPSRRWLTVHYGVAAVMALLAVLLPWEGSATSHHVELPYAGAMVTLGLWKMYRLSRAGIWPRHFDIAFNTALGGVLVLFAAAVLLGLGNVLLAPVSTGTAHFSFDISILAHTTFGLATAAPFASAMLAQTVYALLVAGATIAATALIYFDVPRLAAGVANPELRRLVGLGAISALIGVFTIGGPWLQAVIVRVLFRQSRRTREDLQAFLTRLSPERGTLECCHAALAELARVMQPRGVAILLDDGREAVERDISLASIIPVWPHGPATRSLPTRAFSFYGLRDPRLRTALAAANVGLVVPVISPRRQWGHVFVSGGLLGQATRDEHHVETLEAFGAGLALVLDAADLLARAVAVERSLAHAEKLAAIGETAARIAHDIRNPVTAARSLAQQLACEPGSPFTEEHAVILAELERVERQVADLLRFARREEFRLDPVDLAPLVRTTVEQCRPRLEATGIRVELDVPGDAMARADRERIRQVLLNLIENAADALADGVTVRRLAVALHRVDGSAVIRVTDSGPGVPDDALPRLFEPFFSLKPHGTGLGLAIAKRTVDAHGGRISAACAGGGMTLTIELPLVERSA